MCGLIAAVFKRERFLNVNEITGNFISRGPDDKGWYVKSLNSQLSGRSNCCVSGSVFLGHRRLSVIDLSDNSWQPFSYSDRYYIVFNGEIYNFNELKRDLSKLGYSFKSLGDAEVILIGYIAWGNSVVNKLNGMFSFVIFDAVKNIFVVARDRFGIKPLYFIDNSDKENFNLWI